MHPTDEPNMLTWREFERDLRTTKRSLRTIQSYQEAAEELADFTAWRWCTGGCEHTTHDGAVSTSALPAHTRHRREAVHLVT